MCKEGHDNKVKQAAAARAAEIKKQEAQKQYQIDSHKHRRNASLITAACITAVFIISLIVSFATGSVEFSWGGLLAYLVFMVFIYTFIAQLFWNGFVVDVLLAGFKIIGTPGVIFTLDLDGIIFLIGVKILFAVLKLVVLLVLMLLTTICAIIVSPFAVVPQLIKYSRGEEV